MLRLADEFGEALELAIEFSDLLEQLRHLPGGVLLLSAQLRDELAGFRHDGAEGPSDGFTFTVPAVACALTALMKLTAQHVDVVDTAIASHPSAPSNRADKAKTPDPQPMSNIRHAVPSRSTAASVKYRRHVAVVG